MKKNERGKGNTVGTVESGQAALLPLLPLPLQGDRDTPRERERRTVQNESLRILANINRLASPVPCAPGLYGVEFWPLEKILATTARQKASGRCQHSISE